MVVERQYRRIKDHETEVIEAIAVELQKPDAKPRSAIATAVQTVKERHAGDRPSPFAPRTVAQQPGQKVESSADQLGMSDPADGSLETELAKAQARIAELEAEIVRLNTMVRGREVAAEEIQNDLDRLQAAYNALATAPGLIPVLVGAVTNPDGLYARGKTHGIERFGEFVSICQAVSTAAASNGTS